MNLKRVIARYEAIPHLQSSYTRVSVQFAIASYLAMTIWKKEITVEKIAWLRSRRCRKYKMCNQLINQHQ